jgi:hypothetical protein
MKPRVKAADDRHRRRRVADDQANAVWDEAKQRWISDAPVAETGFVAFHPAAAWASISPVGWSCAGPAQAPLACDGSERGELFAPRRHQAFVTNSMLSLVEADQCPSPTRAVVVQVIAELKDGPTAHLAQGGSGSVVT